MPANPLDCTGCITSCPSAIDWLPWKHKLPLTVSSVDVVTWPWAWNICSVPRFPGFQTAKLSRKAEPQSLNSMKLVILLLLFHEKILQAMLWHHYARVNSHQRWKQTRFRVCFYLWCELTITMNVAEWQVSWNSWKSFFGRKILDLEIFAPPPGRFCPPWKFS